MAPLRRRSGSHQPDEPLPRRHDGLTLVSKGPRRALLTVHIVCSVGWLGAVATYLVVAVLAMTSSDTAQLRVAYPLMEQLTWYVIVPFNIMSLASGITSSLASPWGLLLHYWVTIKLVLNLVTTLFLLGYAQEIHALVRVANRPVLGAYELQMLREPLNVVHAAVAQLMLLIASALAVYKPRGLTRYGYRRATRAAGDRPVVDARA